MADIGTIRPASAPVVPTRAALPAEPVVRITLPTESPLLPGETAQAQVVALKQSLQSFQLLLQLTLANGRQLTLPAESTSPLPTGSLLNIMALSSTRLAVQIEAKAETPLKSLDTKALPPGTLLQTRVVSSQPADASEGQISFKSVVTLLNGALAGKQLIIESLNALKPGSLITVAVRDAQQVALVPSSGRLDQIELGHLLTAQFQRQGSLAQLFQALPLLTDSPATRGVLRDTLGQLLASVPEVEELKNPNVVKSLFERSGILLERHLISGETERLPQDYKTLLLRLIGQLSQTTTTSTFPPQVGVPNLPGSLRNALTALGQGNPKHAALSFPLPSRIVSSLLQGGMELEELLKLATAALSRLQTHQLSGVEQTQHYSDGSMLLTWQGELPMRNGERITCLQYKLQEERPSKSASELRDSIWKLDLAFDLEPLGNMQVEAKLARGTLSSQFWAEQKETAALITHELEHFKERLLEAGLLVGELQCTLGKPVRGLRTHIEERWIDENA
ncbi:flagellar hook-length control protein FliK [Pseudomonas luteola]|uniref:Flagellar hook-length control protein FliK n=1 Tax=Pseudomonas luteola TaxID=47886 RepID=A0ABS0MM50_PSELU|nr:flagellar hook-length control protein FliK [Pseudomonas luteola]MBH3437118.1 flagellar hook-length control protein FliK [Pseudomonas luteola]